MSVENQEPEATTESADAGPAIRLHEENETAERNSVVGNSGSIGINEGLDGRRVRAILQNGGRIDATSLTEADMDLQQIDRITEQIGDTGSQLSFANVSAELRAANRAFFDGLDQRGIAVTTDRENPDTVAPAADQERAEASTPVSVNQVA